jgi:hypothetical protein
MHKTTRFHFVDLIKNGEVCIESNEILCVKSQVRFKDKFYEVVKTYMEILEEGTSLYHHICMEQLSNNKQ